MGNKLESVSNGLPLVLRPSSTKHGPPTGPIQKPIHLKAHLFFCEEKPIFLEEGAIPGKPSFLLASTYASVSPQFPRSPSSSLFQKNAHLLPRSYRKRMLLFFHSYRKPKPSFFPTRTATRLVSGYSTQTSELSATPARKMESAGPSTKKMRLPPAATLVADPAPGSAGRSGEPPPPTRM